MRPYVARNRRVLVIPVIELTSGGEAAVALETASEARAEDVFLNQLRRKTTYSVVFFVAV